ncbi:MAG: hypothetical protein RBQ77_02250 [Candidatus Methanomethylophilaceae archaeon]|jgi:hypothetical protein|nr:hypothetical protein [Candidatus Methanomethylophilaceae archaeon]NLF33821.1 hypothetical protein [Thermoplasmatales archaeon]
MDRVTVKDRILLHLGRFEMMNGDEIYNVPWDLTQDGIANSLRISRAHASIELKKMRESGLVDEHHAQIKGSGSSKRKVFFLTPSGRGECHGTRKRMDSEGIFIDALLDLRRCDPVVLWESLDPECQEVMGLACAFRVPIPRKDLPPTRVQVVPFDPPTGMIMISDSVRSNYLSVVDSDKVRQWNSFAADYWMDNGEEIQEQLYHLIAAGRRTEACKLISRRRDEFWNNANEDLYSMICDLGEVSGKYAEELYSMRTEVALQNMDAEGIRASAAMLLPYDPEGAELYLADADLVDGMPERALERLHSVVGSSGADLRMAGALLGLGRLEEAEGALLRAEAVINRTGNTAGLDRLLLCKAELSYRRGSLDDAVKHLSKARIHASARDKGRIDRLTKDLLSGKGPVRFA